MCYVVLFQRTWPGALIVELMDQRVSRNRIQFVLACRNQSRSRNTLGVGLPILFCLAVGRCLIFVIEMSMVERQARMFRVAVIFILLKEVKMS